MDKVKGLGDVKKIWGDDYGCDERQEILNDLVSFEDKNRVIQKPKPTPKL